jgi:hypothetical protein
MFFIIGGYNEIYRCPLKLYVKNEVEYACNEDKNEGNSELVGFGDGKRGEWIGAWEEVSHNDEDTQSK